MPFRSKAQMRHLFANEPKVAEEFAKKTSLKKKLPERVGSPVDDGKNRTRHKAMGRIMKGGK